MKVVVWDKGNTGQEITVSQERVAMVKPESFYVGTFSRSEDNREFHLWVEKYKHIALGKWLYSYEVWSEGYENESDLMGLPYGTEWHFESFGDAIGAGLVGLYRNGIRMLEASSDTFHPIKEGE